MRRSLRLATHLLARDFARCRLFLGPAAHLAAAPQRAMRPPPLPPASCVAFDGPDECQLEQRPQALQWDFGVPPSDGI